MTLMEFSSSTLTRTAIVPRAENLTALLVKFTRIWRMRMASPHSSAGRDASISRRSCSPLISAGTACIDMTSSMVCAREKFFSSSVNASDSSLEMSMMLSRVDINRPDLILLDIMMPGYPNGLELLDIVKNNKVMTTKIVMISAKGQFDDVVAAAKLRCDAYIIKPFTRQHLLDTIKTVLDSEEGGTTS